MEMSNPAEVPPRGVYARQNRRQSSMPMKNNWVLLFQDKSMAAQFIFKTFFFSLSLSFSLLVKDIQW